MSRSAARLAKEDEADSFYDLVYDKLNAMWRELEYLGRMSKVAERRDDIASDALTQFLADQLHLQDFSVVDAKKAIGEAMVNAKNQEAEPEDEEEEEEEEDE